MLVFLAANLGFFFSLRSFARSSLSVFTPRLSRAELFLPILDFFHIGPPTFVQSSGHLGFAASVCDFMTVDFPMFVRGFVWLGLSLSVFGDCAHESGAGLPVVQWTHLDPSLLPRSFAQLGLISLASGSTQMALSLSLQHFSRVALSSLLLGVSCIDLLMPALNTVHAALVLSTRSFGQLGFPSSVAEFACLDFVLSVRSLVCQEPASLAFQVTNLGLSLPLQQFAKLAPPLFTLGVSRAELPPFALGSSHIGSLAFAKSLA